MIKLEQTADGILLPVRAQPKASKNEVVGYHDGALKVAVTQVPEKGKANAAIIKVLAKRLGLKRSQLALVKGETTQQKIILVSDIPLAELSARIEALFS